MMGFPPRPSQPSFWDEQCPARRPGLNHAHNFNCSVEHGNHLGDECCDCNLRASNWRPAMKEPTVTDLPDTVHAYVFTVAGRCGSCGKPQDDHPLELDEAVTDGCTLDHRTITSFQLVGENGLEWTKCPRCQTYIEPKFSTGEPVGQPWGKGRGSITDRLAKRLGFVDWLSRRIAP